jgi:hypothetical protein
MTKKCCGKTMDARGICWSEDKGYGQSDYAILLQCKKCGNIKIINKGGGRQEDD